METKQLKIEIEESIKKHLASGGKIVRGSYGLSCWTSDGIYRSNVWSAYNNCCCGLSCLLLGKDVNKYFDYYMPDLNWRDSFINGFDGHEFGTNNKLDVYQFGMEMWRRYGAQ